MDIIDSCIGQTRVVTLSGPLNMFSAPSLLIHATGLCATGIGPILIDFEQVPHLTSAGLRALVQINRRAQQFGVGLAMCGLNKVVHDVCDVSGILEVVRAYPDQASALAAIDQPGAP
jgi:anti-anti-sigma factor